MGKWAKIPEASAITGLSPYNLYRGCKEGRYPHIRTGLGSGKILIDIALLTQTLEQEALNNIQQTQPVANVVNFGQLRKVKP